MEQKKSPGRLKTLFSVTFIAIFAIGIGLWIQMHNAPAQALSTPELKGGTLLTTEFAPDPFDLQATQIGHLSNAKLRGKDKWSLLFFGFTNCKTICPTTLSELKQTSQLLANMKHVIVPQVYFVSVDPERDTLDIMQKYLGHFDKNFIGATSTPDAIKAMTKNFGIAYAKVTSNKKADYEINHSGVVILIDPKGHWLALLQPPLAASTMAKDIALAQTYYKAKYRN
ncbi:MAG: hypothetical protein A3F17_01345 [Gammaproteobacteria bacterium RIFCSPHIGHO2_12_FULL_41_15]|nr:MAG: hypothetical protein A3F17_01345 [Gammaproteobacteria bacterium RIFCSPHIGHO2_12_FULL_41_15]